MRWVAVFGSVFLNAGVFATANHALALPSQLPALGLGSSNLLSGEPGYGRFWFFQRCLIDERHVGKLSRYVKYIDPGDQSAKGYGYYNCVLRLKDGTAKQIWMRTDWNDNGAQAEELDDILFILPEQKFVM